MHKGEHGKDGSRHRPGGILFISWPSTSSLGPWFNLICNFTFSYLILSKIIGRKRLRTWSLVGADLGQLVYIYVACNLRTCAVCRLHGAKYAVCRLHGHILFRNFSKISGFPRESTSWQNYLTERKITSVFLTMVIIRFLACNWGKQWQVCSHGMNGCCDELDSLLPKCPPSFSHNTTL